MHALLRSGVIMTMAVLVACGSSDPTEPPEEGVTVVDLAGVSFSPSAVTISVGETIRWTNRDGVLHTVTPDGHSAWTEATLSANGQTFEHTFTQAGTFEYYCAPHLQEGMTGVIQVNAAP